MSFLDDVQLKEVINIIGHVVLSASLTSFLWTQLYGAKSCSFFYTHFLLDVDRENTTGNSFYDALLNASLFIIVVAAMTFLMLKFVVMRLKRTIVCFLQLSQLGLIIVLPYITFHDILEAVGLQGELAVALQILLVATYSSIALLSYFSSRLPATVHHLFIVTNCSMAALFYLRCLPRYTVWLVLLAVIIWDLFSVRFKAGPFRTIVEHAQEYGANVLRFTVFSSEERDEDEDSDTDSIEERYSGQPDAVTRTAYEALHSGGAQLGMGDFVFFGLLVAKSCEVHPFGAVAAMVGIVVGLLISFHVSSFLEANDRYFYLPALPLSLGLGMTLHLGSVCVANFITKRGLFAIL